MPVYSVAWKAVGAIFSIALIRFFYRLCQVRRQVREAAAKHGVPLLPHSFIWGHLVVVGKTMAKYPNNAYGQLMPLFVAMDHPELEAPGLMYIDLWPVTPPMIAVFHPDLMAQFTQEVSLPKHPLLEGEFMPFTQLKDLLTMSGKEWKTWRNIFNPAFSINNILSMVPAFLEEIDVFVEQLKLAAKSGGVIRLEKPATMCTVDIIGRAILDIRLHSQTNTNELYEAISRQIKLMWTSNRPDQLVMALNPFRPFRMWNNNRIIRNYLVPHIKRGIQEHISGEVKGQKTINSLATKAYLSGKATSTADVARVDQGFIDIAIAQMKIFIFAGHDTTATTLCYAYHLLSKNPEALARIRAEHETIFGPDRSTVRAQLVESPALLNQLPYTSAVIKETLRLYPPAGTIRQGQPDFFLTHPDTGKRYPTAGLMLFGSSGVSHRMEEFWPRAGEFLPERWLAREGEPLHVRKNAFRPFELGPRNCIGQELAQVELRAILAMTVREMDIESAYPEDGPEVLGDKAYQVLEVGTITNHPKDGMPVRVKMRDTKV